MNSVLGIFHSSQDFLQALRALRQQGFCHMEAISSQDIEGVDDILSFSTRAPCYSVAALCGALTGLIGGFAMQWIANVEQTPLNVGGRPLDSWPAFIPVTFVLMILCSALALTITFFLDLRLPWPSHPLFETSLNLPHGEFGLVVHAADPLFETTAVSALLKRLNAERIEEVPCES